VSEMKDERFIGECEMYQHQVVETMKEYGLIYAEEENLIEEYLFSTNRMGVAK